MDKKKLISNELQSWHWFIPLFAVVFVMFSFILSGNSYAFTESEYHDLIDVIDSLYMDKVNDSSSLIYTTDSQKNSHWIKNLFYERYGTSLLDYDGVVVVFNNSYFKLFFYPTDNTSVFVSGSSIRIYSISGSVSAKYGEAQYNSSVPSWYNSYFDSQGTKFSNISSNYFYSNNIIYNGSSEWESSQNLIYTPTPPNTITLISSSNTKFSFNDFNQCRVYLTGDWDFYDDFTFMLQRYIDNDWEDFAGTLDYLKLLDYENPYYVHWVNMNYYPVGTYRYRALYNDSLADFYYSEPFEITSSYIDNDVTGTVDSNGDIDITIDTGPTVDNIKDFLGQGATVTDEQFSNNFPTVEVDDPSEDFFSWIFDQIENIFTSTSAQTLQFELFGTTYSYSSNDVYVPNNTLKTLIGLSCDFSICMWIIKDVRKVINKIKEGNIEALSDEDITANMV